MVNSDLRLVSLSCLSFNITQEVPMRPKALVMIATLIALALPLAVSAQEKKDAAEMSITGCFHISCTAVE
jgi:hypothetical protein